MILTPHHLWTGTCPNLSHLGIFGCLTYTHITAHECKKLDLKRLKCIFIGYGAPNGIKGYCIYDHESRKVISTRDVIFSKDSLIQLGSVTSDSRSSPVSEDFYTIPNPPPPIIPKSVPYQLNFEQFSHLLMPKGDLGPFSRPNTQSPGQPPKIMIDSILDLSLNLRSHLQLAQLDSLPPPRTSSCKTRGTWQSIKFHDANLFSHAFLTHDKDPSSVTEAFQSIDVAHWKQPMNIEYQSLLNNKT